MMPFTPIMRTGMEEFDEGQNMLMNEEVALGAEEIDFVMHQQVIRREVVLLRRQSLPYSQIALITKLPLSTVKLILHKYFTTPDLILQNFRKTQAGRHRRLDHTHIRYITNMLKSLDGVTTLKMLTAALRTEFSELRNIAVSTVWRYITRTLRLSKTLASTRNPRVLNNAAYKEKWLGLRAEVDYINTQQRPDLQH